MDALWPIEPFPLAASRSEYQKLVTPIARTKVGFDDEERNKSLVSLILLQLVGYLHKK